MLNTYRLEVRAQCPVNDGERDLYQVTITSPSVIQVESILGFFDAYKHEKIYQEELTRKASMTLGAQVETVGIHSGVTVRSVAP